MQVSTTDYQTGKFKISWEHLKSLKAVVLVSHIFTAREAAHNQDLWFLTGGLVLFGYSPPRSWSAEQKICQGVNKDK